MGNSKKSTWIGGTAFIAVVLMAMAWFLLVSPVLSQADETKAQTEQTEQQNVVLRQKVDELKADFAHLEEYKAELAGLQKGIPTTVQLSSYLRQLNDVAAAYGVVVTQLTPSNPQAITLATPVGTNPADASGGVSTEAPASDPTPSPSPSAGAGDATAEPAQPAAPAVPAGMSAVPVSVIVMGTYQNTLAFLDGLQKTERLFLVGGMNAQAQEENAQQDGRPATELADLELTVDGFIWVLPDGTLGAAPVGEGEEEPPLPTPGSDRNPFYPIEGSDSASSD